MDLDLEKIILAFSETKPSVNFLLKYAGRYHPENLRIFYNPKQCEDQFDIYVTLVHEVMHHYEFEEFMDHDAFDDYARSLLKEKPEILEFLETYVGAKWEKY